MLGSNIYSLLLKESTLYSMPCVTQDKLFLLAVGEMLQLGVLDAT
jgi:hypothetical protein